jgi:hypothetical protein
MKHQIRSIQRPSKTAAAPLAALCGLFLANTGGAADLSAQGPAADTNSVATSAVVQKPAWLTDLSVGVREGYDNNVFLSGVDQKYVPAGTATLENRGSWVTTVSPKIGVNFVPLLGDQKSLQALSLGYAPDFVSYGSQSAESYTAHRAATGIKGGNGAFSFNAEDSFIYVNGSQQGPVYPGNLLNAWATIFAKDRVEQLQDRAKINLQYDWDRWFVRPAAALIYYDMKTALLNPALATTPSGYQNYEDRNDVNGGADVGWKFLPQLAATLGYRYGH